MTSRAANAGEKRNIAFAPILRAALTAAVVTVALILLFALLLKMGWMGEDAIPIVNQVIKVASIVLAAYLATRRPEVKRGLMGLLAGMLYIALGFVMFSLVEGSFQFSVGLLIDLAMGAIVGLLAGLIVGVREQGTRMHNA